MVLLGLVRSCGFVGISSFVCNSDSKYNCILKLFSCFLCVPIVLISITFVSCKNGELYSEKNIKYLNGLHLHATKLIANANNVIYS